MSAFDASAWLGDRNVRPTDAVIQQIRNYDAGLYRCGLDQIVQHGGYFVLPLAVNADANATTKTGVAHEARIPFKVVGAEVGAEVAAVSAGTAMIEKAPAATPTTFGDLLEADVDIKTAIGVMQAGEGTDGEEDIAVGDRLRMSVTGIGSGALTGSVAHLHCFRL